MSGVVTVRCSCVKASFTDRPRLHVVTSQIVTLSLSSPDINDVGDAGDNDEPTTVSCGSITRYASHEFLQLNQSLHLSAPLHPSLDGAISTACIATWFTFGNVGQQLTVTGFNQPSLGVATLALIAECTVLHDL